VLVDWSRPDENADVDSAFDRKKKGKLTAAEWVVEYLRNAGIVPKRKVIADGAAAGYSESAMKRRNKEARGAYAPTGWISRRGVVVAQPRRGRECVVVAV
jgi:hypothetical protein